MENLNQFERTLKRQQARFLTHLQKNKQLNSKLERDVKRMFRFLKEDLDTLQGNDKESDNERQKQISI